MRPDDDLPPILTPPGNVRGPGGRPRQPAKVYWVRRGFVAVFAFGILLVLVTSLADRGDGEELPADAETTAVGDAGEPEVEADETQVVPEPTPGLLANPAATGRPYPGEVEGLLTFRGNPSRTYYGRGPVPSAPQVEWAIPASGGMCSESSVSGNTKVWCGTGWTGQPAVFERDDRTWVVFGAYDRAVHFLDAATGADILPPFVTGDIIKGSVTIDPDGYPLVYTGSRDNFYRVLAIDGPAATEAWRLSADAVSPTMWNNDWDSTGLVLEGLLLEGGENSQFHVVELNRDYDDEGMVTVDPDLVFNTPGWDSELLTALANNRASDVSIENSVAVFENTVYFANSGGLVQGWDLEPLRNGGEPTQTFRFWAGDDIDASIVIDEEGFLYVAAEYERENARAKDVGQLLKLDPSNPTMPIVWSVDDQATTPAGFWATPALHRDVLIAPTNAGNILGVDRKTGVVRWTVPLAGPTWQSPVVVDDVLIEGDCAGVLHAFDVADTAVVPPELWSVDLGGCIESTPAVWDGAIFLGTREGRFFKISDPPTP